MSRTMSAAEFKAKCLEVLDQVATRHEAVVVTKRGKPVAQVVPIVKRPKQLWGAMKGEIEIRGDIMSPLDVEWEATKR
jgi:prevent-host-death family protein